MPNVTMKCSNCGHRVVEVDKQLYHVLLIKYSPEGLDVKLTIECNYRDEKGKCSCKKPREYYFDYSKIDSYDKIVDTSILPKLPKSYDEVMK
jgi:hypothetical protein